MKASLGRTIIVMSFLGWLTLAYADQPASQSYTTQQFTVIQAEIDASH